MQFDPIHMKLTKRQREILYDLDAAGGEALKCGAYFQIGPVLWGAEIKVMERLSKAGCVRLDRVGESLFAVITDRGRSALGQ